MQMYGNTLQLVTTAYDHTNNLPDNRLINGKVIRFN